MDIACEPSSVTDGDLQAVWSQVLMNGFSEGGVTDVVISPGSRSTPLVLAAHHHPVLVCHDVIDERSAGFFALGQARMTQRPTVLICTSGSAGAHYLPALVEARQSALPMVILTADRPPELDQCGANQTVDQIKLFAGHAIAFFDLGTADERALSLRALRRKAVQAITTSRGPVPGGVHLNARFRKPLEPSVGMEHSAVATAAVRGRPLRVIEPAPPRPPVEAVVEMASWLAAARRPLLVAGPAPVTQQAACGPLARLLAKVPAPLFAEATSQLRFRANDRVAADEHDAIASRHVDAFDVLLRAKAGPREAPDLIVQLGATPTAAAWPDFLDRATEAGARHVVIAEHGWHDAQSTASTLVRASVVETLEALEAALGDRSENTSFQDASNPDHLRLDDRASGVVVEGVDERQPWLQDWLRADAAVWRTIERVSFIPGDAPSQLVDEDRDTDGARILMAETEAVQVTAQAVPAGGVLVVGNSLPVRSLDTWVAGNTVDSSVAVVHQRGASGIDGLVSGAAGSAVAAKRPTALLLGDVSLVHDVGGLAVACASMKGASVPLVIVAINNDGGRIFDLLPLADHPKAQGAFAHWRTPHGTDFSHAAEAFGIDFEQCCDATTLKRALQRAWTSPGVRLIEAVVTPGSAREALVGLRQAVAPEEADG